MRNLLQDQLLKAGLAKKHQIDAAARKLERQRDGKAAAPPQDDRIDTRKLAAEKAERDRALEAERKAQAHARELIAQQRQIIEQHRVRADGEIAYRFVDADHVRSLLVGKTQRTQLANGALTIVRHLDGHALLPRAAAQMFRERGGQLVVDHGQDAPVATASVAAPDSDEAYYARFEVPDDLIW